MIYHSAQSDDNLWYLNLRGKKRKKTKTHPNTPFSIPPHFRVLLLSRDSVGVATRY